MSTPSHDLEKRLLIYGLTTGAALLAGAQPVSAGVIFTSVNTPIPLGGSLNVDLNADSTVDFVLANIPGSVGSSLGVLTAVGQQPGDGVFGVPGSFKGGANGAGFGFVKGSIQFPGSAPPFGFINNAIIGVANSIGGGLLPGGGNSGVFPLAFTINNNGTNYGWMRLTGSFTAPFQLSATLVDFAYETEPGANIHLPAAVPEPGTLGMLALGAAGLAALRLKRRKAQ